jgi:hypothetical protein
MFALTVQLGIAHSARLQEVAEPAPESSALLVQTGTRAGCSSLGPGRLASWRPCWESSVASRCMCWIGSRRDLTRRVPLQRWQEALTRQAHDGKAGLDFTLK